MTSAIKVDHLSKSYGSRLAVDNISFEIPRGVICGFVGPNGSGKTTTIRMLLGLIAPSAGKAEVLDQSVANPDRYLARVGALIEGPAFYPALSGEDNLKTLAELGGLDKEQIPGLINRVGLEGRGRDKFKSYSLGMKQRLGIAAALLPNPELLILDEPTNGLDPAGIQEMRQLLRSLADNGITIFVSSHLLSELEQITDHLVVLREGKVLFYGPNEELFAAQHTVISARPEKREDLARLADLLRTHHPEVKIGDLDVRVYADKESSSEINRLAFQAGITLAELAVIRPSLEETFFDMTGAS